jgi:putative FmdB family regulatory protein
LLFLQVHAMPIYAYKCASCGHAKDVLQKMSDAPLTVCPACGTEAFSKQLTAAGFQLKGSGWYATDFRGGAGATAPAAGAAAASTAGDASAAPAPAPAAAADSGGGSTAGGCGTSCACH